jgi:hypothetical protein
MVTILKEGGIKAFFVTLSFFFFCVVLSSSVLIEQIPVTARVDTAALGNKVKGEMRFDLRGGLSEGTIEMDGEARDFNSLELDNGERVSGRFAIRMEFSGNFPGGLFGSLEGNLVLSGKFTDTAGCEAKIQGRGTYSCEIQAPFGRAGLVLDIDPLVTSGCGLKTPQPFPPLLGMIPALNFPVIKEIAGGTDYLPTPVETRPARKAFSEKQERTIPPETPKEISPPVVPVPAAEPGAKPAPPTISAPAGGGGMVVRGGKSPALRALLFVMMSLCILLAAGIAYIGRSRRSPRRGRGTIRNLPSAVLILSGEKSGRLSFALTSRSFQMGRGPENDLVIDDPMVSRIHARIEFDGKGWILRDLGSSNGTRVNGSPVGSVVLSAGDVIKVGESSLEFRR